MLNRYGLNKTSKTVPAIFSVKLLLCPFKQKQAQNQYSGLKNNCICLVIQSIRTTFASTDHLK